MFMLGLAMENKCVGQRFVFQHFNANQDILEEWKSRSKTARSLFLAAFKLRSHISGYSELFGKELNHF